MDGDHLDRRFKAVSVLFLLFLPSTFSFFPHPLFLQGRAREAYEVGLQALWGERAASGAGQGEVIPGLGSPSGKGGVS